ncbi:hypothetical protein BHM03_00018450 [Ensete ventricosum]|nr:hypothetical protein BHM03_00018450 [Ensete ventricosum]
MDLSTLRGMPKMSIGKSTLVARVAPSSPEVEEVRVKATSGTAQAPTPKRADGRPASPQKDGKVAPRIYRRPKSMKDLCGTTVRKDDEGYYILQITDLHPRDPDSELGVLHPQLAKELYVLPSEVLIAQATKQIVEKITIRGLAKVKSKHLAGVRTMRLGTHLECIESSPRVSVACQDGAREFAGRRPRLTIRLSGVAERLPGVGKVLK